MSHAPARHTAPPTIETRGDVLAADRDADTSATAGIRNVVDEALGWAPMRPAAIATSTLAMARCRDGAEREEGDATARGVQWRVQQGRRAERRGEQRRDASVRQTTGRAPLRMLQRPRQVDGEAV